MAIPSIFLRLCKTQTVHSFCVVAVIHPPSGLLIVNYCYGIKGKKVKKAHTSQRPVHHWVTPPPSMLSVPTCTLVYREIKWSKVPCLRKQGNGRGLNPGPPDLNFETTWPHTPPHCYSFLFTKILN